MHFVILKENFYKALSNINRIIPVKPQLPILNNVLIQTDNSQIKLSATNLESGIIVNIGAKIEEKGETTIPGKLLTEFISSLPAEKIEVFLEKENVRIKTGKVSAMFNTISAKEFPPLPTFDSKADIVLNLEQLKNGVSRTSFAASIDEGRPVLTGIRVRMEKGGLSFSATDGYRLSIDQEKLEKVSEEAQFIFPSKTLVEVVRIAQEEQKEHIGLNILKEKNQAVFSIGSTQIVSRLIDGEFPNIEKIIPTGYKTKVTFETERFLQSVKTASLFARGASNIIKLKAVKDGVSLSANMPQVGEDQDFLEAKVEGEETEIAFNYRFLLDLLNNYPDKEITLESSGPLNPGVFKPAKNSVSFLHIIMPVRLQG